MGIELFQPVRTASCITDSVLVGFSGGKDSIVTLDLCCRHFKKVVPFFLYLVEGLSFQDATLRWYEAKYGVEILRMPHPMLSVMLRLGMYRKSSDEFPEINFNDLYHFLRLTNDIWWIAAGERIADSIVRRAMIKKSSSIDKKRGRFFPVANFIKADVLAYMRHKRLKMAPEYQILGESFSGIDPHEAVKIRQYFPSDFKKIVRIFPFVEAGCVKYEMQQRAKKDDPPKV